MKILSLRTDNPEAEIGLFDNDKKLEYFVWQAHRELSDTLLTNIKLILDKQGLNFKDIEGVIIYKGPGSFTGLRIGFSVANTLAYSLGCDVVATNEEDWIKHGLSLIKQKDLPKQVFPFYGAEVNITKSKK
jgi:tRNA threonylcarbamoyladenosine biosynthesis protein TsaB